MNRPTDALRVAARPLTPRSHAGRRALPAPACTPTPRSDATRAASATRRARRALACALAAATLVAAGTSSTAAAAGAAPASGREEAPAAPVTALLAGRVIDPATGTVRTNQVVLVENGRIRAVGASGSVEIPANARRVDLAGYTLMPGFIDTHTHLTTDPRIPIYRRLSLSVPRQTLIGAANARRTLLAGFTTVRDVGSMGYSDVALRDAIDAGEIVGPRVYASGPSIGIAGGHCDMNLLRPEIPYHAEGVANGPDAVRVAVRQNVRYGADVIKYCGTGGVFSKGTVPGRQQFTAEEVAALVDEAHMHGRRVAVHAHGADGIKVAIRAGVDSVEHASLIDDEGLKLAKERGTFLSMDIYNTDYTQAEGKKNDVPEEFLKKDRDVGDIQRENFRRAVRAGIKLTLGSDAGIYPHGDNARQFAVMTAYGMTPMQAIQAATVRGAELLGAEKELGTLAVGAHADLVAVTGDPLADVRALQQMGFVMKGGTIYVGPGAQPAP